MSQAAATRTLKFECYYCHKKGHLASVCRKKAADSKPTEQAHRVEAELSSEEYPMYTVNTPTNKPLLVVVNLNRVGTKMEVDTEASVSIIAEDEFQKLRADGATFHPTNAKLSTYTGESIPVAGATEVQVKHHGQVVTLPLIVTRGRGPCLLGRDWLTTVKLDWTEIFSVHTNRCYRTFWRHTKKCSRKDWEPSVVCLPRSMSTRTQPHSFTERGHSPIP